MSRKLGETGTVVIAVYFNAEGFPKRAEIAKSSGYERLDQAALAAALASQVTPFKLDRMFLCELEDLVSNGDLKPGETSGVDEHYRQTRRCGHALRP